jgi:hypothetical protein
VVKKIGLAKKPENNSKINKKAAKLINNFLM